MSAREGAATAPGQAAYEAREVLTRKVLAVAGEHAVDVMILADTYAAAAISEAVTAAAAAQPAPIATLNGEPVTPFTITIEGGEAEPAPGDLRPALESLARFWVREYVTADGWPDVCAKQLLDVLGGAREPKPEQPAPGLAAAPELREAMAETRKVREQLATVLGWLRAVDGITRVQVGNVTRAQLARAYQDGGLQVPEELRRFL